jgi:hypothetical protein
MIYTHVLNRGGLAVRSPLDQVDAHLALRSFRPPSPEQRDETQPH